VQHGFCTICFIKSSFGFEISSSKKISKLEHLSKDEQLPNAYTGSMQYSAPTLPQENVRLLSVFWPSAQVHETITFLLVTCNYSPILFFNSQTQQ